MGVPSIEKCPPGLDPRWSAVWRLTRDELKSAGTFSASMRPLLDEFVFALKAAEQARQGFDWLDSLEEYAENAEDLPEIAWSVLRQIAGNMPVLWDKHSKRAAGLADQLGLTPKAALALSKKAGDADADKDADPFAGLDELDEKRRARSSA